MDFVTGNELKVTRKYPYLVQVDTNDALDKQLDPSAAMVMDLDPFYFFGQLFDEDDISVVQKEGSEEVESANFLYDENGGDCLLDMGISVPTEIKEEDITATNFPMFIDCFLADFTR